ncbi:MAG: hypothetical protein ACE15C_15760 [Phycisphaerae bacterium]
MSVESDARKLIEPFAPPGRIWDFVVPYDHSKAILKAAPGPKRLRPDLSHGHAPEFCREGWVLKQFDELLCLARRK